MIGIDIYYSSIPSCSQTSTTGYGPRILKTQTLVITSTIAISV